MVGQAEGARRGGGDNGLEEESWGDSGQGLHGQVRLRRAVRATRW